MADLSDTFMYVVVYEQHRHRRGHREDWVTQYRTFYWPEHDKEGTAINRRNADLFIDGIRGDADVRNVRLVAFELNSTVQVKP